MILIKYQNLFSLKIMKNKVFQNVVCCRCDWPFKGRLTSSIFKYVSLFILTPNKGLDIMGEVETSVNFEKKGYFESREYSTIKRQTFYIEH